MSINVSAFCETYYDGHALTQLCSACLIRKVTCPPNASCHGAHFICIQCLYHNEEEDDDDDYESTDCDITDDIAEPSMLKNADAIGDCRYCRKRSVCLYTYEPPGGLRSRLICATCYQNKLN